MRILFIICFILFWIPFILLLLLYFAIEESITLFIKKRQQFTPLTFKLRTFFLNKYFSELTNLIFHVFGRKEGESFMGKIFALNSDQVQEFEPKGQEDIPASDRTVFLCRFLNVKLAAELSDEVYTAKGFGKKREELLRAGTQELKILRTGLVGWKNFTYSDGSPVEWKEVPGGVSNAKFFAIMDENLDRIPPEIRSEIADFIRGSSSVDQD